MPVPFQSKGPRGAARDFWENKHIFRSTSGELADGTTLLGRTALHVLAHGGRNVSRIAGDGKPLRAAELVDKCGLCRAPPGMASRETHAGP